MKLREDDAVYERVEDVLKAPPSDLPFRVTAKMGEILRACKRKHFKGATLANEVGLEYNYARRLFAQLVKAGKLRNDPERGYRTI